MEYLRIRNWEKWQSYRADRGQPPWIKVHRRLMRNLQWIELSDSERGQLVSMWLLAGDNEGKIPASPSKIKKICFMSKVPKIQRFIDLGFLEYDVKPTPKRRRNDSPKAKAETKADKSVYGCQFFQKFWSIYPKKEGKGKAWEEWLKIKPKPDENLYLIMEKVINAKSKSEQWQKDNGQFIPLPATWLHQRRWDDEVDEKQIHPTEKHLTDEEIQENKRLKSLYERMGLKEIPK